MGNSVSAHIYETKVFRPCPVILYRLRLDPSIHWWEIIGVHRNDQILGGKVTVLVYMHGQSPIKSMGNSVSAHIYETKVFRPYPVILYRLRLDPSIHWWEKIGVPRNDQIWRTRG